MRKIKPFTDPEPLVNVDGEVIRNYYYDTRTGNIRARWWTKARIPGEVRPGRVKNLVRYGKRMRGFLRLDVYV